MSHPVQRAIGFLFVGLIVAVGPFLLVLAVVSFVRTEIFIHACNEVDGKIVFLDLVHGNKGSAYVPVFRFTTLDGQTSIVTSRTSTTRSQLNVGDHVRVLYMTGHPESARIHSFGQLFRFPMAATILGGALTTLTVLLIRQARRQRTVRSL